MMIMTTALMIRLASIFFLFFLRGSSTVAAFPAGIGFNGFLQGFLIEIGLAQRSKRTFHVLDAPQEEQGHLQLRDIVDFRQQFLEERIGELSEGFGVAKTFE